MKLALIVLPLAIMLGFPRVSAATELSPAEKALLLRYERDADSNFAGVLKDILASKPSAALLMEIWSSRFPDPGFVSRRSALNHLPLIREVALKLLQTFPATGKNEPVRYGEEPSFVLIPQPEKEQIATILIRDLAQRLRDPASWKVPREQMDLLRDIQKTGGVYDYNILLAVTDGNRVFDFRRSGWVEKNDSRGARKDLEEARVPAGRASLIKGDSVQPPKLKDDPIKAAGNSPEPIPTAPAFSVNVISAMTPPAPIPPVVNEKSVPSVEKIKPTDLSASTPVRPEPKVSEPLRLSNSAGSRSISNSVPAKSTAHTGATPKLVSLDLPKAGVRENESPRASSTEPSFDTASKPSEPKSQPTKPLNLSDEFKPSPSASNTPSPLTSPFQTIPPELSRALAQLSTLQNQLAQALPKPVNAVDQSTVGPIGRALQGVGSMIANGSRAIVNRAKKVYGICNLGKLCK